MSVKAIGKTIKSRRSELKITQSYLAELANVSVNTIYKIERGQGNPSLEILSKLANIIGMEIKLEVKKNRP